MRIVIVKVAGGKIILIRILYRWKERRCTELIELRTGTSAVSSYELSNELSGCI